MLQYLGRRISDDTTTIRTLTTNHLRQELVQLGTGLCIRMRRHYRPDDQLTIIQKSIFLDLQNYDRL